MASSAVAYKVADYGLVADSGVTDNAPLLTTMLTLVPQGSIIEFETNGTSWYGFGSTVSIAGSWTFRGNWNRPASGSAIYGAILRPLAASTFAPLVPMFTVTVGRVLWENIAIIGDTASDSGASVAGTNVIQLSITPASWMVGCPIADSAALIPQTWLAPTTITAVDVGAKTVTISQTAGTGLTTVTIYSGYGVQYGSGSHLSKMDRMLVTTFACGVDLASGSDHITLERQEITGNYDNIIIDTGNQFDYSFIDGLVSGCAHASVRLASNSSTVNLSFIRTHLGFGPFGVVQDVGPSSGLNGTLSMGTPVTSIPVTSLTTAVVVNNTILVGTADALDVFSVSAPAAVGATSVSVASRAPTYNHASGAGVYVDLGDSINGMTMIASPIEQVTQHIAVINCGNIYIDHASYWTWNGTPTVSGAFTTVLQNVGPIWFGASLTQSSNPNCAAVFALNPAGGNQDGNFCLFMTPLGTFAASYFPYQSYLGFTLQGTTYFYGPMNGPSSYSSNFTGGMTVGNASFATATALIAKAVVEFENALWLSGAVSKAVSYSTAASDQWIRCTATLTLTLTQNTNNQLIYVTNESASGTVTLAVSAGTLYGPSTIAAGHGATFVSDGTNWRCIGAY